MSQTRPPIGREIDGPGKLFLKDVVMDNVLEALMELSAAVWTHRDRVIVLETILQDVLAKNHDVDLNTLIEMHAPTEEQARQRTAEREAFAQSVFRSFTRNLEPVEA